MFVIAQFIAICLNIILQNHCKNEIHLSFKLNVK